MSPRILQTPILILGSGVAGLSVAFHLEERSAILLSKSPFARGGSTILAQGGIAASIAEDDSPALHAEDTIEAGAGLSKKDIVELVTEEAPEQIRELIRIGAVFDRNRDGKLQLGREGAHSRRRIVRANGDASGAELARALGRAVALKPQIRLFDGVFALDFILDQGRVVGVNAVDAEGEPIVILAGVTIVATGGIGRLWLRTSNPEGATGDGLAMAIRAGARVSGLEFMQFHPTGLLRSGPGPLPLLTEALRGEGAHLVDERGRRFLTEIDARGELAPRDIVARGIFRHQREQHDVFLDASPLKLDFERRFPTVSDFCRKEGLRPGVDPLPITPVAHYLMGGIVTDRNGRSSLPGLYACGEVASTGLHGANRLASNSLLEGLVFGARIGKFLSRSPLSIPRSPGHRRIRVQALDRENPALIHRLQVLMQEEAGIIRSEGGLRRALEEIGEIRAQLTGPGEVLNMLDVAENLCRAALVRRESRGSHYRRDFPHSSASWRQDLLFEGRRCLRPGPMPLTATR